MNELNEQNPNLELFLQYVNKDLNDDERSRFESRLANDPSFKQKFDEFLSTIDHAKTWFAIDAPGSDRVERIAIPYLSEIVNMQQKPRFLPNRWIKQIATAAAIFLIGFYTGQGYSTSDSTSLVPKVETNKPVQELTADLTPVERKEPSLNQTQPGDRHVASLQGVSYTYQQNGKIVVEKTLPESGIRAVMVVDGQFEIE